MAGGPYKSKGGWYHIVWSRRGKKTKEALKTQNIQEARKRKAKLEAQYFEGTHDPFEQRWYEHPESEYMSTEAAAELYISHKLEQKGRKGWKSDRTYTSHRNVIRKFVSFADGRSVAAIDAELVDRFLHRKSINSRYTRVTYKARLDGFFRWCQDKGYIEDRPEVEVNHPQKRVIEYVNDKTLKAVFDQVDEDADDQAYWYGDWCRFALDSGLRPIEVRSLRTSDLTDSDIYVGKSFRTKTNTARKVPLAGMAKMVAENFTDPDFRRKDRILKKSDLLFGRSSQKAISRINRDLKKACKKVGCPELTAKELRHLFAIRFLIQKENKDMGLLRLMRVMGHSRLETTQNYLSYLPHNNKL